MKNNRFAAAVLIPGFLFLFIFAVFPVIYGMGISLYDYNPLNIHNQFLGLMNYRRLIHDELARPWYGSMESQRQTEDC